MTKKTKGKNLHYLGKGIRGEGHTKLDGAPNTNLDIYQKDDGRLRTRRKFGADGKAFVDLDAPSYFHSQGHAHDIVDGERKNKRSFNERERREFNKAKRKRRIKK